MKNYAKTTLEKAPRAELHDVLALTGAEISINTLPKGEGVPFVHQHKENEEIYGILEGCGKVVIDGETVEVKKGDWLRIDPIAKRQFFATTDDLTYICIQVKKDSLTSYTATDGIIL